MRIRQSRLLVVVVLPLLLWSPTWAGQDNRPFWTEKSSFIEGEDLFVVGVASRARTVEEGRKQAFENGKLELMNVAQVTSLEARGLLIETQMTYEQPNPDGTVTVYRLIRVPAAKLVAIQGRLQDEGRVQEQALEKARGDLTALQRSVARKQQELEARSRQVQDMLNSVSHLQETLGQKALRIEQQQREVELLLQQLSSKVRQGGPSQPRTQSPSAPPAPSVSTPKQLAGKLKEAEALLDAQEAQLRDLAQRARDRLAKEDELGRSLERKCGYIKPGMRRKEVDTIMSNPPHPPTLNHVDGTDKQYAYEYMDQKGETRRILVRYAFNGLVSSLYGCPEKSF